MNEKKTIFFAVANMLQTSESIWLNEQEENGMHCTHLNEPNPSKNKTYKTEENTHCVQFVFMF